MNFLKSNKSVGPDEIPDEILKYNDVKLLMFDLFRLCLKIGSIPSMWQKAIIALIPKSTTGNNYNPLTLALTEMKTKMPNTKLIISGLPPRHNNMEIRMKVKDYNEEMKQWCDTNDMTFINNEEMFEYKSGDVDTESYVMTGHTPAVHLTRKATVRMLKNIKKAVPELILSDYSCSKTYAEVVANKNSSWVPSKTTAKSRNNINTRPSGGQARCWFCGIPGHTKSVCKYQQPLRCHSCGNLGHKKKYCESHK